MEFLSILPTAYYTFPVPGYVRFAEHAPYRSGLGLGLGLGLGFSGCFHLIQVQMCRIRISLKWSAFSSPKRCLRDYSFYTSCRTRRTSLGYRPHGGPIFWQIALAAAGSLSMQMLIFSIRLLSELTGKNYALFLQAEMASTRERTYWALVAAMVPLFS